MGTGELHENGSAAQACDRLAVVALGGVALTQQGADAGFDPQRPLSRYQPRPFGQPLERGPDQLDVTGPGRRLGQLGHDIGPVPELVTLEGSPRGVACRVVATEAVVEHRARAVSEADHPPETPGRR